MNNWKAYPIKGMAALILFSILQTFVCSAFCSIEPDGCCNENKKEMSCCNREGTVAEHPQKTNNCQTDHLAFLHTVGQFHSKNFISLQKVIQPYNYLISLIPVDLISPVKSKIEIYTGFILPPPKEGIPTLNCSFLV